MRCLLLILCCGLCWLHGESRSWDLTLEQTPQPVPAAQEWHRFSERLELPFATTSGVLLIIERDGQLYFGTGGNDDLQALTLGRTVTVPIVWGENTARYHLSVIRPHASVLMVRSHSLATGIGNGRRVVLIDGSVDGTFLDPDDRFALGRGALSASHLLSRTAPMAKVWSLDDGLWNREQSDWPRLTITPFEGPVATVRLPGPETEDGPRFTCSATIARTDGSGSYDLPEHQALRIPGGSYRLSSVALTLLPADGEKATKPGLIGRMLGVEPDRSSQSLVLSGSRMPDAVQSLMGDDQILTLGPPLRIEADPVLLHGCLLVTRVDLVGQGGETYQPQGAPFTWALHEGATNRVLGSLEYG